MLGFVNCMIRIRISTTR